MEVIGTIKKNLVPLGLISLRGMTIIAQLLFVQQMTSKLGVDFVGDFSTCYFNSIFLSWIFSFGIINANILEDSENEMAFIQKEKRCASVMRMGYFFSAMIVILLFQQFEVFISLLGGLIFLLSLLLINIHSLLLSKKKYLEQAFLVFILPFLFVIVLLLNDDITVLNLMIYCCLVYFGVILVFYDIIYRLIFNYKWVSKNDFNTLKQTLMADSTSYLMNRGDYLIISYLAIIDGFYLGIYYIFLQVLDGVNNIGKALGFIIQREYSENVKRGKMISFAIILVVLITLLLLVYFYNYWTKYFNEDLLQFGRYFGLWSVAIMAYTILSIMRYVAYSKGIFNGVSRINLFSIAAFILTITILNFMDFDFLLSVIIAKVVSYLLGVVISARILGKVQPIG